MGLIQGKIKFGFTVTDITSHNISRNHFVMFYFVFTMTCLFKVASMEGDVERSQNTVLLASTQAVYKAPHSTVRKGVVSVAVNKQ